MSIDFNVRKTDLIHNKWAKIKKNGVVCIFHFYSMQYFSQTESDFHAWSFVMITTSWGKYRNEKCEMRNVYLHASNMKILSFRRHATLVHKPHWHLTEIVFIPSRTACVVYLFSLLYESDESESRLLSKESHV